MSPISRRPQGEGTTSRRPRDVVSGTPGGDDLGRGAGQHLWSRARSPVVSKIRPPWTPLPARLPDHPALASRGLAPTRIADMLASLSFIHVGVERGQRPSQGGRREALLIRGAGTYSLKATSTAAGRNTSTRSPTSSPAVCSSSAIARTAFPRRAPGPFNEYVHGTGIRATPSVSRSPPRTFQASATARPRRRRQWWRRRTARSTCWVHSQPRRQRDDRRVLRRAMADANGCGR